MYFVGKTMMYILKNCCFLLCVLMISCTKEFNRNIYVTTDSVYNKSTVYMVSGNIVDAGEGITHYGHCWSTKKNPTIEGHHSIYNKINKTGQFESQLDSISFNNNYYIRSFVKNQNEVVYGNEIRFNYNIPVTIENYYYIDVDSILIKISLDTAYKASIDEYGYCWSSVNALPTKEGDNNYTFENNLSKNSQYSCLAGLKPNQKYYIRAYSKINNVILYSGTKTFTTGTLLYYNSLDSKNEIENNASFPFLQQISYKIDNWDQAQILPACVANGLFVNHDMQEGWKNDGANFFALNAQDINLPPERGTIAFSFVFKSDSDTSNYAYFFDMADSLKGHYDNEVIKQGIYFSAGWSGWAQVGKEKHFFFTIGNTNENEMVTIKTNINNAKLYEILNFKENDIFHFTYTWDVNGIYDTDETMNIYINNTKAAYTKETWTFDDDINEYLFIGATPGFNYRDQNFNAVKGITDELKIYNFVKYKGEIPEEY